jgi:acetyl esterase/lipase
MNLEQTFTLFFAWVNCLYAFQATAAPSSGTVRHEKGVLYAGKGHPEQVLDVFTPEQKSGSAGDGQAAGRDADAPVKGRALIVMMSGGFMSNPEMATGMAPFLEGLARDSGCTVFAVAHGSQPRFVIAEIVPQIARAVRFIRYHSKRFGIDPSRIGALGFSSGGHLALMTGLKEDNHLTTSTDPIDHASSRVQAVVAFFPPTDFLNYGSPGTVGMGEGMLAQFRSAFFHEGRPCGDARAMGRAISPRDQVTPSAAPTLLIHGDADTLVPIQQSRIFLQAMKDAGRPCELRVRHGQGHGWADMAEDLKEARAWFDRYLTPTP